VNGTEENIFIHVASDLHKAIGAPSTMSVERGVGDAASSSRRPIDAHGGGRSVTAVTIRLCDIA
jgi:hypothetical protein